MLNNVEFSSSNNNNFGNEQFLKSKIQGLSEFIFLYVFVSNEILHQFGTFNETRSLSLSLPLSPYLLHSFAFPYRSRFLSFRTHKQSFTLLDYRHRYNHLMWFLFHLNYTMMILFCGRINSTMYVQMRSALN